MFRNRSDFKSYVSGKVKYFRSRSLSGSYSYVIGDTAQIFRKLDQGMTRRQGLFVDMQTTRKCEVLISKSGILV